MAGAASAADRDERPQWLGSFAQDPDGRIDVTSSSIVDDMWFNPAAGPAIRTELWCMNEG